MVHVYTYSHPRMHAHAQIVRIRTKEMAKKNTFKQYGSSFFRGPDYCYRHAPRKGGKKKKNMMICVREILFWPSYNKKKYKGLQINFSISHVLFREHRHR